MSGYDKINVTGTVEFVSQLRLEITLGYDPVDYVDTFSVVVNDGFDSDARRAW